MKTTFPILCALLFCLPSARAQTNDDHKTLRVFIFAGQSNMVGSDSKVQDIKRFPPYSGLEAAQEKVKFVYCLGRENKIRSEGWEALVPINNIVGPERFARKVTRHIKAPIAIIKVAAGGTHLGDWNPDESIGFKMCSLALETIRKALVDLTSNRSNIASKGSCGIRVRTTCSTRSTCPTTART